MIYVSWALIHEGPSDAAYLEVLIPRVIEGLVAASDSRRSEVPNTPAVRLGRNGRGIDTIAAEVCAAREAIEMVFIHADTDGRAREAGLAHRSDAYCDRMTRLCDWPSARCVRVSPRHETEAWILSDPAAILGALGYRGDHRKIGLPDDAWAAERLSDPKAVLGDALRQITGSRHRRVRVERLFPAIAQRQSLDSLRQSTSFQTFEVSLIRCLRDIGCVF